MLLAQPMQRLEDRNSLFSSEETIASHGFIAECRREHDSVHGNGRKQLEEFSDLVQPGCPIDGGINQDLEAGSARRPHRGNGTIKDSCAPSKAIVRLCQAVEVKDKTQVGRRSEFLEGILEQESVGTQIHESLVRNDARDYLADLRMYERFPASDAHYGSACFFHSLQTVRQSHRPIQDILVFSDTATPRASQIT